MRNTWFCLAALGALAVSGPTLAAQGAATSGWTNGGMLGSGQQGFYGTFGFPGLTVGYLRGVSDTLDVGARFSFNYGGEGVPSAPAPGIKLAADLKLGLNAGLPYALTLRFLPGINLYFPSGASIFNLALPLELDLGIPVAPNLLIHPSLLVPFSIGFWSTGFGSFTSMQIPLLFGAGVEWKVDRSLSLHAQLHMGPYVQAVLGGFTTTTFAFDSLLGLTYRLP